jgi:hypothetical protein
VSRDDYAYEERMAICIHDGGTTEEQAQAIASAQTGRYVHPTHSQALKRWMDAAQTRHGIRAQKAAAMLMRHHGVTSMDELTVNQLLSNVERMSES